MEFTNAGPAGTSAVKTPGYCKAKGRSYDCGTSELALYEGGRLTYTFQLKIGRRMAHAKGSVTLSTEARPFDPDKTNDKADITLDVTGGGATDSPGSATDGRNAWNGSSSPPDGSSSTGDSLAETGPLALPVAGVAAAATATGAAMLAIARRRRAQS
ncbi:hypothetical protein [Streptomyces cylindrosporus]|uniref:Gram-positive cocci surface proteins LPxTG domain-containing protein n=1 Tax=Streptomyces cylindrosporus TaxID=2927583 RepID=A0ABS9Y881_9ACTN|nr:hypothetical protein [Streptomyces cylindrosporus]MCI3272710.1 hypothetical protein [Streptomyces cylindrosporus]